MRRTQSTWPGMKRFLHKSRVLNDIVRVRVNGADEVVLRRRGSEDRREMSYFDFFFFR